MYTIYILYTPYICDMYYMYILESYSCILACHLLKVSFVRCKTHTWEIKTKVTLYMKIGGSYFFPSIRTQLMWEKTPQLNTSKQELHFQSTLSSSSSLLPFFPKFLDVKCFFLIEISVYWHKKTHNKMAVSIRYRQLLRKNRWCDLPWKTPH